MAKAKAIKDPEAAPLRLPDTWEAYALKRCAMEMGKWLEENKSDFNKSINKLSLREMMGMAWACCAEYTNLREIERNKMRISAFDDEAIDDLGFILRRGNRPSTS